MLLYSSDAPAGWNALPTAVKEKFYNIASKGDWTATEAYDHLVPDILKDEPQEVATWMDGGEVTITDWNQQTKMYEETTYEVPDRDVSRIVSGENGGEYSVENTIMEDMSVNRARGAANMTDTEYAAAVEQNATDIDIIENAFEGAAEATYESAEVFIAPVAETTASTTFEAVSDAIGFAAPPVILAMKAGRAFSEDPDEQAGAAMTVGTIATFGMFTPAAPLIGTGALLWSLWGLGECVVGWFNQPSYR